MALTFPDLAATDEAVLEIIREQAIKRLESQCTFVQAQEARATSLVGATATLAAATAAAAVAAVALSKPQHALLMAAITGTLMLSASAMVALISLWSGNFDAPGWYPDDFEEDVKSKRTVREITTDFILDAEIRLQRNLARLAFRGRLFNAAASLLVATPLACLLMAWRL